MGTSGDGVHVAEYGWGSAAPTHAGGYLFSPVLWALKQYRSERVIDIGAGNGAFCGELLRAGYQVVGIDADANGMSLAAEAHPGAVFHTLAVENSPEVLLETEERFDAAVSMEVVEHLFEPSHLPAFAHDVLEPGGVLIVTTPYHGWLKNVAIAATGHWDRHHTVHWDGGHIKFWSRKTLTELLERNGFEVISFVGIGRLPYLWKSMMLVARRREEASVVD